MATQLHLKTQSMALLSLVALIIAGTNAQRVNLTLYHVNPANYTGISNMNTGDAGGDAFFSLKSLFDAYSCASNGSNPRYHHHCSNPEETSHNLTVTEVVVEVDSNFGVYAECNICVNGTASFSNSPCVDGDYVCVCNDPAGMRDCNSGDTAVGREFPASRFGGGGGFGPRDPQVSALANLTNGTWFATLAPGECANGNQAACTWRIVQTAKRIWSSCQEANVKQAVMDLGSACFNGCPQPTNSSTLCWIDCYSQTLLGIAMNGTVTGPGMTGQEMIDMWLNPIRKDVSDGGCPPV